MAKTETRNKTEAESVKTPDPPVNGEEGLKRLADLTRRVIAVPKSEVVDPPKRKKKR
jgi:hypothetical protein